MVAMTQENNALLDHHPNGSQMSSLTETDVLETSFLATYDSLSVSSRSESPAPEVNPTENTITDRLGKVDQSEILSDGDRSFATSASAALTTSEADERAAVTWASLPRKGQLAVLTIARLSEPITSTSLQSYLYYQLASFDPQESTAVISTRVGFVLSAFPAAQAVTSILWGRIADSPRFGRKNVLIIGLLGTALGSTGFGLTGSWQAAAFWRVVSGALNGNVGVLRTMVSEIVREKKYQSRAFLLLPMCFNIGTIIGPVFGGLLAAPYTSYPRAFGPGSWLGGELGVLWMKKWPYALPNFVSAIVLISAALVVFLSLEETLESRRRKLDYGIWFRRSISLSVRQLFKRSRHLYSSVATTESDASHIDISIGHERSSTGRSSSDARNSRRLNTSNILPFRQIWTRNVVNTLLSRFLLSLTVGTFQSLWFIFLSAPRDRQSVASSTGHFSVFFSGGLALLPSSVGAAMAILGSIGIVLQIFFYPIVSARVDTLTSFRFALALFPPVFTAIPFLSLISNNTPIGQALLWTCLAAILAVHVLARTFALPAAAILVNNCSPHPSVLGTVHGIAQSVGSSARFVGPVVGGAIFGAGVNMGVVGLAWWILAGVGGLSWVVSLWLREGDGHEILMEGEEREQE